MSAVRSEVRVQPALFFAEHQYGDIFSRNWWILLARGLIALALGITAWRLSNPSLTSLLVLFGAYTMVDGILRVSVAVSGHEDSRHQGVLLLCGLISMGVGIVALYVPAVKPVMLVYFIAAWALGTGIIDIGVGLHLRNEIGGGWILVAGGIALVAFGVALVLKPSSGALVLSWLMAGFATFFGLMLLALAARARSFGRLRVPHPLEGVRET